MEGIKKTKFCSEQCEMDSNDYTGLFHYSHNHLLLMLFLVMLTWKKVVFVSFADSR